VLISSENILKDKSSRFFLNTWILKSLSTDMICTYAIVTYNLDRESICIFLYVHYQRHWHNWVHWHRTKTNKTKNTTHKLPCYSQSIISSLWGRTKQHLRWIPTREDSAQLPVAHAKHILPVTWLTSHPITWLPVLIHRAIHRKCGFDLRGSLGCAHHP
jgi:hypothetical protein